MSENQMTTYEIILEVAKKEFLEKGYKEASLRSISNKAGVTTGALYGYFKNKKELFGALVDESYNGLLNFFRVVIKDFTNLSAEEQYNVMEDCTRKCMKDMTNYMYDHYDAFKLILCCSEGTDYNNLAHEMAVIHNDSTIGFTKSSEEAGINLKPVNKKLEHMLTTGMFATFLEMIIHDIPREEAEEYTDQLLDFFIGGWGQLMGFQLAK